MPSPADSAPAAPETPRGRAPFVARALATGFGTGYFPWASGTAGTAAGLLVTLIPGVGSPVILGSLIVAGFFAGRWAANLTAREMGHTLQSGAAAAKRVFQGDGHAVHPDPSAVVIDEIVGIWTALLLLPAGLPSLIIAFTTFRAFDIVKPPPCAALERAGDGWGIMLDDLAAGVYANLATRVILWVIG
jgi:phosphatidylglycerophosphatase A